MARKYGLSATLTLEEWLATLAHFHWKCAYCQSAPYTVLEHFEPMIVRGDTPDTTVFRRATSAISASKDCIQITSLLNMAWMKESRVCAPIWLLSGGKRSSKVRSVGERMLLKRHNLLSKKSHWNWGNE
jgi:hypothetical protein